MRRVYIVLVILCAVLSPVYADLELTDDCQTFTTFDDWFIRVGDDEYDPPSIYMVDGMLEMSYDFGRTYALNQIEILYEADDSTDWRLDIASGGMLDTVDPAYNLLYQVTGSQMAYTWEGSIAGDSLTVVYTGDGEDEGLPITGVTVCVTENPPTTTAVLMLIAIMYEPLAVSAAITFGFGIALVLIWIVLAILS
jgi:hypothetical protein